MRPVHLVAAGEALWPATWKPYLCSVLKVDERTLRRWLAGDDPIPPGIAADLDGVLMVRIERLEAIRQGIAETRAKP